MTHHGKDLARYYGDFLIGVIFQLAANTATNAPAAPRLIGDTLYVTQLGQLAELLTEERRLRAPNVEDVLLIGEQKTAHYCCLLSLPSSGRSGGARGFHFRPTSRIGFRGGVVS